LQEALYALHSAYRIYTTALHRTPLFTAVHCTVNFIVHCTVHLPVHLTLQYTALQYTTLHYTALQYTTLHYTALQ
jgi:hypothetical protein